MIEKVCGIVLSETPFNESSKIIQVLTKEHGQIGIIAKGAKKIKSRLRAVTNKFTYGYFHIYYKEGKLSELIQVDIIDNFTNIKNDIVLISYMTYLCDLTYQVIKQNYDKNVLLILLSGLDKLNYGFDPLIITNIIETKYLEYLGVALNLDCCNKCGNKNDIVTISLAAGGYICKNCYTNEHIVDQKTIKMIRNYFYVDIDSISKISITSKTKNEINQFLTNYYESYTGLYLKSKEFLNNLLSMN